MGFIDLTADLENLIASQYSDARGPVIRGAHTELAMVHLAEGQGAEQHVHDSEQWVVILEGLLQIEAGDDHRELTSGQAYFIPGGVPHSTRAIETTRALSFKDISTQQYRATQHAE